MMDPEVLEEFKVEADEMLNESEDALLSMEKGEDFPGNFNAVFRSFHSLKGAAGMFEIDPLQSFMHIVEGQFESLRNNGKMTQQQVDYFLKAVDGARKILSNEDPGLDTDLFDDMTSEAKPAKAPTQAPAQPEEVKQEAPVETKETPAQETKKKPVSSQDTQEIKKKAEQRRIDRSKKKGKILVVDDEAFICESLCDILEHHNFEAVSFTDPREALESLTQDHYDIVCSDLKMPHLTGLDLLEQSKEKKIQVGFIFITAYIDNKLLTEGLDNGASGFLEKPFEEHQVISLVRNVLEKEQTKKLLNRSINYILYQFNDLDNYLKSQGKEVLRNSLKLELENLLSLRKEFSSKSR